MTPGGVAGGMGTALPLRVRLASRLAAEREKLRVRRHLARVERDLSASGDGHLPPALRERRRENLRRLRAYIARGRFPRNATAPGARVPVFRDARGALCAVGHLVALSGRADLVDAVAAADNHVRIPDVRDGPLLDWIDANGLTQEEAARIQPSYDWGGYSPPPPPHGLDHPLLSLGSLLLVAAVNFAVATGYGLLGVPGTDWRRLLAPLGVAAAATLGFAGALVAVAPDSPLKPGGEESRLVVAGALAVATAAIAHVVARAARRAG